MWFVSLHGREGVKRPIPLAPQQHQPQTPCSTSYHNATLRRMSDTATATTCEISLSEGLQDAIKSHPFHNLAPNMPEDEFQQMLERTNVLNDHPRHPYWTDGEPILMGDNVFFGDDEEANFTIVAILDQTTVRVTPAFKEPEHTDASFSVDTALLVRSEHGAASVYPPGPLNYAEYCDLHVRAWAPHAAEPINPKSIGSVIVGVVTGSNPEDGAYDFDHDMLLRKWLDRMLTKQELDDLGFDSQSMIGLKAGDMVPSRLSVQTANFGLLVISYDSPAMAAEVLT